MVGYRRILVKKVGVLLFLAVMFASSVFAQCANGIDCAGRRKTLRDQHYDYIYCNPPRHSFMAMGGYGGGFIAATGTVRYVNSPSRLKRAAHAAKINAYNYEAMNY